MESIVAAYDGMIDQISEPVVLAIGSFDGIHLGHRAVINSAREMADCKDAKLVAYSFRPHPSIVIGLPKAMILTRAQKIEKLNSFGVDYFVEQCFDEVFSKILAEEFIIFLKRKFKKIVGICVGENFRFGNNREGDINFLRQISGLIDISIEPFVVVDNQRISSSSVRKYLNSGHIARANSMLGYYYYIYGNIIKGRGIARKLGFPTINMQFDNNVILKLGVYLVRYRFDGEGKYLFGIANFGIRPTFFDGIPNVILEMHCLDKFIAEFSGSTVEVQFLRFIREEKKFNTQSALVNQICRDIKVAKKEIDSLL